MSGVGDSGAAAAVEAALLLTSAATAVQQGVALQGDGGGNEAEMAGAVSDMSHVLTALQQSERGSGSDTLSSVMHTQPQVLSEGEEHVEPSSTHTDPSSRHCMKTSRTRWPNPKHPCTYITAELAHLSTKDTLPC